MGCIQSEQKASFISQGEKRVSVWYARKKQGSALVSA